MASVSWSVIRIEFILFAEMYAIRCERFWFR